MSNLNVLSNTSHRHYRLDPSSDHRAVSDHSDTWPRKDIDASKSRPADHAATITVGERTYGHVRREADRSPRNDTHAPPSRMHAYVDESERMRVSSSARLMAGLGAGDPAIVHGFRGDVAGDGVAPAPREAKALFSASHGPSIHVVPGATRPSVPFSPSNTDPGERASVDVVRDPSNGDDRDAEEATTIIGYTAAAGQAARGVGDVAVGFAQRNPARVATGVARLHQAAAIAGATWTYNNHNVEITPATGERARPNSQFVDSNGRTWTRGPDNSIRHYDAGTGVTTTYEYGNADGREPRTVVTSPNEPAGPGCQDVTVYGTRDGEALPPVTTTVGADGGECPIDTAPSDSPPARRSVDRHESDGSGDYGGGWSDNDVGNGAGSDGDPENGRGSSF